MPLNWTQITLYPTPERGSYCMEVDSLGRIYIVAGWDDSSFNFEGMSRVDRYDPSTDTWGTVANLPTPVRDASCSAVDSQDRVYIIAGSVSGEVNNIRDVDRYDPATDTWTARANLPVERLNADAVCDSQDRVYVVGGYKDGVTRTLYRYDPSSNSWSQLANMPSPPRDSVALGVDDQDRIYVSGGWDGNNRIRRVDRYDPSSNSWTTIAQLPTPGRDDAGGASDKFGRVYVIGGTESGTLDTLGQVDRFDPSLNAWESLARITDWDVPNSSFAFAGIDSQERIWALSSEQTTERAIYQAVANDTPNAPTLDSPTENEVINTDESNRFEWTFNDPDPEDTQSQYELRYRTVGAATWTTVSATTSDTFRDFPAATFAAGDYEWQVRTQDTLGQQGPWSPSEFFEVDSTPATPTIDDPTLDQVIGVNSYQVAWTSTEQDAYQLRKVADDGAGNPVTSNVLYDTGTQVSTNTVHETPFNTNQRTEHIQVRVRENTIWSAWDSVRISVDYVQPADPNFVITPKSNEGHILIEITRDPPEGNEPNTTHMDLLRRKAGETEWLVLVKDATPEFTYEDYTPMSDQEYEYAALSYGDNDTNATSAPNPTPGIELRGSWVHRVEDPSGSIYQFRYNTDGGQDRWEPDVTFSQYAGRRLPVAEFGEFEDGRVSVDLQLDTDTEVQRFIQVVRSKSILCYRDAHRRKVFGIATGYRKAHTFYGGTAPLEIQEIDFSEEDS